MRQSVNFLLLLALSGSASEDTASNDQLWCSVCTVLREIKFYIHMGYGVIKAYSTK